MLLYLMREINLRISVLEDYTSRERLTEQEQKDGGIYLKILCFKRKNV